MNPVILLDAGPLGLLSNPNRKGQTVACRKWLQALVAAARRVIVPEVADYEVRRELLRANKAKGVARLDALAGQLEYLPLTTAAMRRAADKKRARKGVRQEKVSGKKRCQPLMPPGGTQES